jgi:hypothetical protein
LYREIAFVRMPLGSQQHGGKSQQHADTDRRDNIPHHLRRLPHPL